MMEFLRNVVLFSASQAFGYDMATTKKQLTEISKKFDNDKLDLGNYSPEVQNIIEFYLTNRKYLGEW